jgi:deazaflavin-dependent oxidoreductase (nitroreductase family)
MQDSNAAPRYIEPGWFTKHVFNRLVRRLTRMGLSVKGSRELSVVGRSSGVARQVVVNLLTVDGQQYLVAPRGNTQWVRNVRAAGAAELRVGRRVEPVVTTELADADKPTVIREYLHKWSSEVGMFFEGIDEHATDEQVLAIAAGFPVFALQPA